MNVLFYQSIARVKPVVDTVYVFTLCQYRYCAWCYSGRSGIYSRDIWPEHNPLYISGCQAPHSTLTKHPTLPSVFASLSLFRRVILPSSRTPALLPPSRPPALPPSRHTRAVPYGHRQPCGNGLWSRWRVPLACLCWTL